jgi:hypothetical protein
VLPAHLNLTNLELDPIEADRFKKEDFNLNRNLEEIDAIMNGLKIKHSKNLQILAKLAETKSWIFKNRRTITIDQCKSIKMNLQEITSANKS